MGEKVQIDFGINANQFNRDAEQIKGTMNNIKGNFDLLKGSIFATFAITALKSFQDEWKSFVNDLEVAKKQTGANTTELQVWEKQIGRVGGTMEDVVRQLDKLAVAREKALGNPTGAEEKALGNLGLSRTDLVSKDTPDLFRQIQDHVHAIGGSQAVLNDLLTVFGEKAIKYFGMLNDSFSGTEEQLKKTGKLIDSELIEKFGELERISKNNSWSDILLGAGGKAKTSNWWKQSFEEFKSDLGIITGEVIGGLGFGSKPLEHALDNRSRLFNVSSGQLSPTQYESIRNNTGAERQGLLTQIARIDQLKAENAEKELSAQEKLNRLLKEQAKLEADIDKTVNNKEKKTQYLSDVEAALRLVPQIKEAQEKVDKENDKSDKEFKEQQKVVDEFTSKTRAGLFGGSRVPSDSLIETGNFFGRGKSALEDIAQNSEQYLKSIAENIQRIVDNNRNLPLNQQTAFPDNL